MALGSSALHGVPTIINTALSVRPRSVLDLGMGSGKYGYLLREQHDIADVCFGRDDWRLRLVGVEAYAEYIDEIQRIVYDKIVPQDATAFLEANEEQFDVALALDIIEHFDPEVAARFAELALRAARFVIVSTPRGFYTQRGHVNDLETHRSWWPKAALHRLAGDLDAQIAVRQDRYMTLAVLSLSEPPRIASATRAELISQARTRLVPELAWYRLRRATGPTIAL